MTTIRQIVEDAYREAGIYANDDTVSSADFTEGLRRLNVLFKGLFAAELGEPFLSVNYGKANLSNTYAQEQDASSEIDSAYVPSNTRLLLNISAPTTIYLPPNPRDGARFGIVDAAGNLASYNVTIDANGRRIESTATVVLNTNSLQRDWFYRADTGNWVKVTTFVDGDSSPLPEEFDDLLITYLAVRLNPRHGAESSAEMIEVLKRLRKIFKARYLQSSEQDSELGLQWLPSNKRFWKDR